MAGLDAYFDEVAAKYLSAVEVDRRSSHQHEFNGVASLKAMFGSGVRPRDIVAHHFDMDRQDTGQVLKLTWYDARRLHATRSEFRLYYDAALESSLGVGSLLIIASRGDFIYLFTARAGSPGEEALQRLFSLAEIGTRFSQLSGSELHDGEIDLAEQFLLAQLGIPTDEERPLAELMFDTFGPTFPKGEKLSSFVREHTHGVDPLSDPDDAILAWARVELELFNAMEARVETDNMNSANDLDAKLEIAMRVFQRRRSRAGKAFEYHLRAIFDLHDVSYAANAVTERGEEPDFVFPGIAAYRDPSFPVAKLTVLAAKQTLRDRWRQVLNEASRIQPKHLATLDTNLSSNQIAEIAGAGIQLVVPLGLHHGYRDVDSATFWSVAEFLSWVRR